MKILSLIPARGGSKSIYKKNIRMLGGKPLIQYSIEVSLTSPLIERTIVSTDDQEIAEIARACGAEVPFMRPNEFAQDTSPDKPVFVHALEWLLVHESYEPDFVLHLRPTTPFRSTMDIENVLNLWKETGCDAIRSVSLVDGISHPYHAYVENMNGYGEPFINDKALQKEFFRRQDLPPVYKAHGLVDGYTPRAIFESDDMLGEKLKLYIVDDAIDIDSINDFEYAEYLLQRGKVRMCSSIEQPKC